MAARWGVGEEILTACNVDFFPMDTLDEASGLNSEETLEVLQSCIDPSILSIFEDMSTIETKGLDDDESEATLLTALTEILDNVDDENLSPFDTLPDSDLLSNQKVREQSPLRRMMCQSRSPPEKDPLCSSRPLSTGKTLPRIHPDSLQRSDGEEEDDNSLTPSPVRQDLSPDHNLLDWEGLALPLPMNFDQGAEDGLSVSLGDLVRHMHPYCMAICLENDDGQQMLPEGGILLEVVDQAENGDPILAIPDMALPLSLPLKDEPTKNEQKMLEESEVASDSSEHIVVDDDDDEDIVTAPKSLIKVASSATPQLHSDANDEMINKKHKEKREKIPSRRKKKKKCKEESQPEPEERRVLRSGTVRKMPQEAPIKQKEKTSVKEEKKPKLLKVPQATNVASSLETQKEPNQHQTKAQTGITTTRPLPDVNTQAATSVLPTHDKVPINTGPEKRQSSCALQTPSPQKPVEPVALASEKIEDSSAATLAVLPQLFSESPAAAPSPVAPLMASPVAEALPSVAPAVSEPKPKSLSLAEYRRLRQQKKPAPVEKQDGNSTKWPSLQELPKELPPIPCLPDPGLKDRRPSTQTTKKEVEEVKPAWQPRGPAAPPTPEALLAPPAYMVASSNKVSAATTIPKPHQTPEPSKPSLIPNPPGPAPNAADTLPLQQHTKCQPAVPTVPLNSGSPVSLKPVNQLSSTSDKSSPVLSTENCAISKSTGLTKTCLQTTTEVNKQIAATVSAPSAPQNTTVSQRVPEVTAATSLDNPITSHSKSSKTTAGLIQLSSTPAAHLSESRSQKAKPVVLETKENCTTTLNRTKSPTQELIEAFTSEIGIEAADLTSLLEQFEETQAKEEQCVPEVSGKAAAVGNSSFESAPENTVVERVRANDLSSTAALTPPATPPHQMWKPLAPVALLGKSKAVETPKLSPSKAIQIEPRPLPSIRSRSKPTPASAPIAPEVACMDHDYCLPTMSISTGEPGKRWNVKQQSFITIKPIKQTPAATTQTCPASLAPSAKVQPAVTTKTHFPPTVPLDHRTDGLERNSVLETPDASPTRKDTDSALKEESPRRGSSWRSYRRHAESHTPNPRSSPNKRTGARSRKRSHRSPSPLSSESESDSHSSRSRSRSHSPSKKRYRSRLSESSSTSSSRSSSRSSPSVSRSPPRRRRHSYSSSRSGSWSRSRSRSRSPDRRAEWSRNRRMYSPSYDPVYGQSARIDGEESKWRKEKAIEERRVVYVGRIRGTMTQKELRERFSLFGKIEECTLHFRNQGDNYGFVTYYDTKDAFTAIENGSKLRKPDELPFDLCFGGRRQFCKSNYSDLDSSREYDPFPAKRKFNALDFDTLLKQAQQNMKR